MTTSPTFYHLCFLWQRSMLGARCSQKASIRLEKMSKIAWRQLLSHRREKPIPDQHTADYLPCDVALLPVQGIWISWETLSQSKWVTILENEGLYFLPPCVCLCFPSLPPRSHTQPREKMNSGRAGAHAGSGAEVGGTGNQKTRSTCPDKIWLDVQTSPCSQVLPFCCCCCCFQIMQLISLSCGGVFTILRSH